MEYKGYAIIGEFLTETRTYTMDKNGYVQDELNIIDHDLDEPMYYGLVVDQETEWFDSLAELKTYVDEELVK